MARCFAQLLCSDSARYTHVMTMMDLGPERPGPASDTRQMVDKDIASNSGARLSGRVFWIVFSLIAIGISVAIILVK